ncbi:MAG: hypothetical protein RR007_00215 [Kiritimatiellia bacterium]
MKALLIFLFLSLFALPLRAFDYLSYNLTTQEATPVSEPVTLSDPQWRNATSMLFVKAAKENFYIGVFEVTQGQAKELGWSQAIEHSTAAFSESGTSTWKNRANALTTSHHALSFPAFAQWTAFDGTPAPSSDNSFIPDHTIYNLSDGNMWNLVLWDTKRPSFTANSFGVVDYYGNVAEYVADTNSFYGGGWRTTWQNAKTALAPSDSTNQAHTEQGARLIYTAPTEKTYSVTITLDKNETSKQEGIKAGADVTFTPPIVKAGHRLSDPTLTPSSLTVAGTNFVMPSENVTLAYHSIAVVTIAVQGGTADKSQYDVGATVTLKPTFPSANVWTLKNTTTTISNPYTIPAETAAGATMTFVAKKFPRVLLYGGTATADPTDSDKTYGYYVPQAKLTLTANAAPHGYQFKSWTTGTGTETSPYTVGEYDTTVTLTATYELSGSPQGVTLHIGAEKYETTETEQVYNPTTGEYDTVTTTKTNYRHFPAFGNEPDKAGKNPTDAYDNAYQRYPYAAPRSSYASLNLKDKSISYYPLLPPPSPKDGDSMFNQTLTLKRVTRADDSAFYLSVFETTNGQIETLRLLSVPAATPDKDKDLINNLFPYSNRIRGKGEFAGDFDTQLTRLNTAFGIVARAPNAADLTAIGDAKRKTTSQDKDKNYSRYGTGAGSNYDPSIEKSMVQCDVPDGCVRIGTKKPDPYGFYDLWGNYAEWTGGAKNGNSYNSIGGHANALFEHCNIGWNEPWLSVAFRPLIEAVKPVIFSLSVDSTGDLKGKLGNFVAIPGKVLNLGEPLRPGYIFDGWQRKGKEESTFTKLVEPYTVLPSDEGMVLETAFSKSELSVTYVNCSGPSPVTSGTVTTVYPDFSKGKFVKLTSSDTTLATVGAADGTTVTFQPNVKGAVTVTATYEAVQSSGYLLRMR